MEASLNTWTIIFLIAAVQGLFLSIMIFLRRSKVNSLLGFLILAFSICLLYYVAYWTGYYRQLTWIIGSAQGLTYLFGPLVYFYICSDRKTFSINTWHFSPFVLYLIYFLSQPFFSAPYSLAVRITQVILQNFHLIIYTGLMLTWISKRHGNLKNGEIKLYRWKKMVSYAFAGYTISFLSYYILVWTGTLKIEYDYMISIASSFFIYFIGYHGFQNPQVLKVQEHTKYDRSSLSESAANSIRRKLKEHMTVKKPYLDSSLKLQQLAEQLDLSPHHISQAINELEGQNFSDFINQYRIHEATTILQDPAQADKKIIHIALDTGFNNKTSFNSAFKKFTGSSPSEYRNRQSPHVGSLTFK